MLLIARLIFWRSCRHRIQGTPASQSTAQIGLEYAIGWYARFPNHYSGDGSVATKELGEWNMNNWIAATVEAIRAVKADDQSLKLQNEFYEKSKHPLDTRP